MWKNVGVAPAKKQLMLALLPEWCALSGLQAPGWRENGKFLADPENALIPLPPFPEWLSVSSAC